MTLPSGETPLGTLGFGELEDFAAAAGGDWILLLINQITTAATGYVNLQAAIEKVASQIGFPEFAQLLLAAFEGIVGAFWDFLPWFINLTALLGGIDLNLDPAEFNPIAAGIAVIKWLLGLLLPGDLADIPLLSDMFDSVQDLSDTIWQAITGLTGTGNTLNDILNVLRSIPFGNILGTLGPANIGGAIESAVNTIIGGFTNVVGAIGGSFADLFGVTNIIGSNSFLGALAWDYTGIRNNTSMDSGMLATSQSNLSLSKIGAGSAPGYTFGITQTTGITSWQRIKETGSIGVVRWYGSGTTSVTTFQVILWRINSDGYMAVIHASPNIVGDLNTSGYGINAYIPSTGIDVTAGDIIGIELALTGAGTHTVVGDQSWLGDDPIAIPKRRTSIRDNTQVYPSDFLGDLSDDFYVQRDANWTGWSGNVYISSHRLRIDPTSSSPTLTLANAANFTGKQAIIEVPVASSNSCWTMFVIESVADPTDTVYIMKFGASGSNMYFREATNGSTTSETAISYNSSTHRWWRMMLYSGTVYWGTSPDGISWTNQKSKSLGSMDLTSVRVKLICGFSSEASPGHAEFDHYNTITSANINGSTNIPFIETAPEVGVGSTYHSPQIVQFTASGTQAIPTWANTVEVVCLGGGGGGHGGNAFFAGDGGGGGSFSHSTWVRGTDFTGDDVTVTVTVGAGGTAGFSGSGGDGGSSSASIPGPITVTASGGHGATTAVGNYFGNGPGTDHYGSPAIDYVGGAQQNVPSSAGNPPGGGGAGGAKSGVAPGIGNAGAAGSVWLRFLQ